jgi:hypothetical protein
MRERKVAQKIFVVKPNGKRRVILKTISVLWLEGAAWAGLVWLKVGTSCVLF